MLTIGNQLKYFFKYFISVKVFVLSNINVLVLVFVNDDDKPGDVT